MYALVDCNNFYVSCERVFNPQLNYKPVLVLSNNDGCVISRSNEAKLLGIKMGEPAFKIQSIIKNKNIHTFSTNFALYGDMSQRIMNTLSQIIPSIEIYSIDEAFLDLNDFSYKNLNDLGLFIRNKILKDIGIPVSIGIARTKTLAKIANQLAKKSSGVFLIKKNIENTILNKFPIDNIWGIGKKNKFFLNSYGIKTAKEFKDINLKWIKTKMNIVAEKMVKELNGIPCFNIHANSKNKKSICTSRTFGYLVNNQSNLESSIAMYTVRCAEKLRAQHSSANIAHVFISTNPFRRDLQQYHNVQIINFPVATNDTGEMIKYILKGFRKIYRSGYQYKKAGVMLSGIISNNEVQGNLFDNKNRFKSQKIMIVIDKINKKMGRDKIRYAAQGYSNKWKLKQKSLSPCYTTRWSDILVINI